MVGCALLTLNAQTFCSVVQFETIMTSASNAETNTAAFWKFIKEQQYVIVKFYENWCGPCRSLSQVVERVMKQYPQVAVLEIPAAKYPINGYKITSLPTVVYFLNGTQVASYTGYVEDAVFIERIKTQFGL